MTVFSMTVVQVAPKSATSKAGKPYRLVEVAYTNHTWQDKIESAKINQYAPIFSKVAEMQVGQTYNVTKEKDASGYFQWIGIEAGAAVAPQAAQMGTLMAGPVPKQNQNALASGGTATRSTYETPEERAKKQVYIVKQSSISAAVALLTTGAKIPPSTELVLKEAQKFVDFVFDEKAPTLADLQDIPNDLDMQVE
jgi:hypothetical protein